MKRAVLIVVAALCAGCGRASIGAPVEFTVPQGTSFAAVADTLARRGIVRRPTLFRAYARLKGVDGAVKAGRYSMAPGWSWKRILRNLTAGRVLTTRVTIPEGFRLTQIAPRVAELTGLTPDSVLRALSEPGADSVFDVPGPGLEGYLFPDTYRFAASVPLDTVIRVMIRRYRRVWTPARRARLDSLSMTRGEITTLASIVQAEALHAEEMPRIASVYHNRLRLGWLLQADPTVLYALGGPRARLLFAAIDSVADSPYNTYTQAGLPPGPIGAPGEAAIDAALWPTGEPFLYFVARPNGSHIFSRTLAEHTRAVARAKRERAQVNDTLPDRGR